MLQRKVKEERADSKNLEYIVLLSLLFAFATSAPRIRKLTSQEIISSNMSMSEKTIIEQDV